MSDEITEKAQEMGWVPQEEWKGDPEKWRPAEEFVSRGENIIPILKARLDKSEKDMDMALKLIKSQVEESRKQGYEQAKREYEKELVTLKRKEVEAVETGDVQTYNAIQAEKANLKPPAEPTQQTPTTNPVFEEWHKKNDWYQNDPELTEDAEAIGISLRNKNLPPEEFYSAIEKKIKKMHPEKFSNPNREKPGATEGGSRGPGKSNGKSWGDLPSEAKTTFSRLEKQWKMKGRTLDKEEYVKTYFEE